MARTLKQSVFAGGRVYAAGTAESDVDADVPDKFWTGSSSRSKTKTEPTTPPADQGSGDGAGEAGSGDGETKSYADRKVGELKAEIDSRNEGRDDDAKIMVEGTGKGGNVVQADLVAALEADDAR